MGRVPSLEACRLALEDRKGRPLRRFVCLADSHRGACIGIAENARPVGLQPSLARALPHGHENRWAASLTPALASRIALSLPSPLKPTRSHRASKVNEHHGAISECHRCNLSVTVGCMIVPELVISRLQGARSYRVPGAPGSLAMAGDANAASTKADWKRGMRFHFRAPEPGSSENLTQWVRRSLWAFALDMHCGLPDKRSESALRPHLRRCVRGSDAPGRMRRPWRC